MPLSTRAPAGSTWTARWAEALADPDPWHGFCRMIERIAELHVHNQGFTAAFLMLDPSTDSG